MDQRLAHLVEHITNQNIYVTGMGECWHADYLCARVQRYGRTDNGPPEGHADDFRDIDG